MSPKAHSSIGNHSQSLFPELARSGEPNESGPSAQPYSVRQEVLNVLVAQLLQERGVVAAPEQILKEPFGRRMPDVLVDYQGLRLMIEGEVASPTAKEKAGESALNRVEEGIAHIAMALVYPAHLRSLGRDGAKLKQALSQEALQFAVITESDAMQAQLAFPEHPEKQTEFVRFTTGNLDAVVDALARAYEQLLKDDVLERAASALDNAIGTFLSSFEIQPATLKRFAEALDIRELPKRKKKTRDEDIE